MAQWVRAFAEDLGSVSSIHIVAYSYGQLISWVSNILLWPAPLAWCLCRHEAWT